MEKCSKIILVNPEKRVLLYLRDDVPTISNPGYWDLFGGHIENGETDLEAIQRELGEEANLSVKGIKKISILKTADDKGVEYKISMFTGKVHTKEEEIKLKEGQIARYFRTEELYNLKFNNDFRKFIIGHRKTLGI